MQFHAARRWLLSCPQEMQLKLTHLETHFNNLTWLVPPFPQASVTTKLFIVISASFEEKLLLVITAGNRLDFRRL